MLLALVLGLLVGASYGVYSQQQSEVHILGSQILQLDLVLERYGPAADRGRELLKQKLVASHKRASGAEAALNRSGRPRASRAPRRRIPKALLISVVYRATLLFTCIGASTAFNALAIGCEAMGAAAVASAIYLILEFGHPYSGLFRISPEGIDRVIAELSANMPSSG